MAGSRLSNAHADGRIGNREFNNLLENRYIKAAFSRKIALKNRYIGKFEKKKLAFGGTIDTISLEKLIFVYLLLESS